MSKGLFYDPDKTFDENMDLGPFFTPEPIERDGEPLFEFLGFPIYLPFGIPAGSLPTSKFVSAAFAQGFDVVTYKTMRSVPFPANPFPNVIPIDINGDVTLEQAEEGLTRAEDWPDDPKENTITNSFGNSGRGPKFWVDDMKKAVASAGKGQVMVASVVGTIKDGFSEEDYWDDFAHSASLAKSAGAKIIEINLSCPNVAGEGIICYTPKAVSEITRRVKEAVGTTPVMIKVGYYSPLQHKILIEVLSEVDQYIAAVVAINTIPAKVYDRDGKQALPGEGRLKSGLCGAGIKWAGLDTVRLLDDLRHERGYQYKIVGVGGVMTPDDYMQYREAGADCVQSATGSMWNPDLAKQIINGLR